MLLVLILCGFTALKPAAGTTEGPAHWPAQTQRHLLQTSTLPDPAYAGFNGTILDIKQDDGSQWVRALCPSPSVWLCLTAPAAAVRLTPLVPGKFSKYVALMEHGPVASGKERVALCMHALGFVSALLETCTHACTRTHTHTHVQGCATGLSGNAA